MVHIRNDAMCFVAQQMGMSRWINYDTAIRRLACLRKEDFRQIYGEGSTEVPIFACKFAEKQGYEGWLALANEDGELSVFDTSKTEEFRIGIRAHHNAIFDLAWMPNETKVVTVSGDHTARLLELTPDGLTSLRTFHGHTMSLKSIAFRKEDYWVFSTGSRDGNIAIWDIRSHPMVSQFTPDNLIENAHIIKQSTGTTPKRRSPSSHNSFVSGTNSITGLVFQDDNTLISCGAGDGNIKVWDIRKTYSISKNEPVPKHFIPYTGNTLKKGFSCLNLHQNILYASCMDNVIYSYNVGTYNVQPIMKYVGYKNRSFYVKACLSKDGRYLLSGSTDNNAYIWNVNSSEPISKLSGHSDEVTCVDWSSKDMTIVTCSDDMSHKIWRLGTEYTPENWEIIGAGKSSPISFIEKVKTCNGCKENKYFSEDCICPKVRKRLQMDSCEANMIKKPCYSYKSALDLGTLASIAEEITENNECKTPKSQRTIFEENFESPTVNLPNFVIDGNAPHLHYSPQKKREPDWLTKLRIEKRLRKRMRELSSEESTSDNKQPRIDMSPRSSENRRNLSDLGKRGPLFRYFRATNSSNSKEINQFSMHRAEKYQEN